MDPPPSHAPDLNPAAAAPEGWARLLVWRTGPAPRDPQTLADDLYGGVLGLYVVLVPLWGGIAFASSEGGASSWRGVVRLFALWAAYTPPAVAIAYAFWWQWTRPPTRLTAELARTALLTLPLAPLALLIVLAASELRVEAPPFLLVNVHVAIGATVLGAIYAALLYARLRPQPRPQLEDGLGGDLGDGLTGEREQARDDAASAGEGA